MVSMSISTPALMITAAMITPRYASRLTPVVMKITAETSTETEITASKSASLPLAVRAAEFTFLPVART